MSNWKRKLALLLTLAMLISALPLNASAAEEAAEEPTAEDAALEEIGFQMRYMGEMVDAIATVNPDKLDAGVEEDEEGSVTAYYVPFEDDGGYTFYPERTEMPYTVRFDVNGREFVYVFGTESDTTVIGGHEFRVECQDTPEPEVPEDEQLYVTVGGEEIPLIPQDAPATMSMLPLKEQRYSLNLQGYFPNELKEFGIGDLLNKIKTQYPSGESETNPEKVAAWARTSYYDEEGNRISDDDYTLVSDSKVIDLSYSGNISSIRLELIVGTVDQLNPGNIRYIINVSVSRVYNLKPFTFTFDDVAIGGDPVSRSNYYEDNYRDQHGNFKNMYQIAVKSESDWDGDSPVALKLVEDTDFWNVFNKDSNLTYDIYEGYHESADGLTGSVKTAFTGAGLTKDYKVDDYDELPTFTAVFSRSGKVVFVMPFITQMYKANDSVNLEYYLYGNTGSSSSDRVANHNRTVRDSVTGLRQWQYTMYEGKEPNAEYYARAYFHHNDTPVAIAQIGDYVKKTVDGYYKTEAEATGTDITAALFGSDGYKANYSNGKIFTVILKNGTIRYLSLKAVAYEVPEKIPDAPTPLSADTYFRMEGAMQGTEASKTSLNAYVMPYNADSYYYNGFQTVFLLNQDNTAVADGTEIKPDFWTDPKVVMFAGHNKDGHTASAERQTDCVTPHSFTNGETILYSAAAENGANLKNYWVTFVTQDTNGAKLFVNGINDPSRIDEETKNPTREVMLIDEYGNHHDIFFANIGDTQLEGLSVKLEDAQNVALDEYWTIGATKTLDPFTTTNDRATEYGELANVAKIRLIPQKDAQGNIMAGDIKGTLTISSTNGGTVKLKLTGKSGAPKIVTDTIRDGIKFVHYSSLIQTNYMYGSGDIAFTITGGRLPNGLRLKPNGEIYGVPTEVGEFTIEVTATNTKTNQSDKHSYTFKIEQNTYDNVEAANMDDQGYPIKNRLPDNIEGTMWSQDQVLESEGEYSQFMNVYLDGRQLTANTDYTSEEGSTKITVRSQTLRNAGNGTHTISAEFRTGHSTSGTMKRTAQNFTISGLSTPSGGGSSSGGSSSGGSSSGRRPSSSTPKPATKPAETPAQTPTTPTAPATTAEKFKDISAQQWFYADVDWAFKNNLMVGVTDSSYHPYDKISFVTGVVVLSRLDKVDLDQQTPAEGIPAGQWYTAAASWAKANDLLPENGFQGSSAMSRGEMAVMLLKYLKYMKVDCSLLGSPVEFTDAALMTQEQNDAFQVLYQFGIFKGVGNQTMDVSGSTTRAQFAALLHRLSVFAEAQQKNA